jgi:hypothetical protein
MQREVEPSRSGSLVSPIADDQIERKSTLLHGNSETVDKISPKRQGNSKKKSSE